MYPNIFYPADAAETKKKAKNENRQHRAGLLRASLNADQLVYLCKRDLRDHFEHFDERIDTWAQDSKRPFADMIVYEDNKIRGLTDDESFRILNRNTLEVAFNGQTFSLVNLHNEIEHLYPQALNEIYRPWGAPRV